MLLAYQWEFHRLGGWELKADGGYRGLNSCPGVWWEPAVCVLYPCEDAAVVYCIGSLNVEEV